MSHSLNQTADSLAVQTLTPIPRTKVDPRTAELHIHDQTAVPHASMKARKLTVGSAPLDKPGTEVPYLRLRGRWLKDAGFAIGRYVKVEVREGCLMIQPID